MPNPNEDQGQKFAKNGIALAIIVLVLIIVGYLYYHFAPPTSPPPNTVPATPASEPVVPVDNNPATVDTTETSVVE